MNDMNNKGMFDSPLPLKARKQLETLGVEVRTSCPVEDLGAGFVKAGGERIEAANIIWGAGVEAHPITRTPDVRDDQDHRVTDGMVAKLKTG